MSAWREARAAWRLALTAGHIILGLALSAGVVPLLAQSRRDALRQWWSRTLLRALGVRLVHEGEAIPAGALLVANHVSWLDVFAINAVSPATFVCKAEVRNWPAIGWLVARNGTLFLDRGSRAAAVAMNRELASALRAGTTVALFPEGTSSDGAAVLPFHAALFQPAIDTRAVVVPVCVAHMSGGARSAAPAYCDDVGFGESLVAIARAQTLETQVIVLSSLFSGTQARREIALQARDLIASRLARIAPHSAPETPAGLPAALRSDTLPTDSPNPAPAAFLRA